LRQGLQRPVTWLVVPIDAVIFDLDDTLIDWWGSIETCLRRIAPNAVTEALLTHCRSTLWHLDPTESFTWHRNTWALHYFRQTEWAVALPHMPQAEREALMQRFDDELFVEFFVEIESTLDELAASTRLAILSNNHLLADEVRRLGLDRWFDIALHASAPTQKPHPDAFGPVLSALGLEPGRCAYVGDSVKADVNGSMGAGLVPVWVDRWNDTWADRPDTVHRVSTLAELPRLLATL
jgi:putative hydrolase of the HAD superfamily